MSYTGNSVLSNLTLNCDFDLGPSNTVPAHCTHSNDACYIKFLKLMKGLWTGQDFFFSFDLELDL